MDGHIVWFEENKHKRAECVLLLKVNCAVSLLSFPGFPQKCPRIPALIKFSHRSASWLLIPSALPLLFSSLLCLLLVPAFLFFLRF